jgi:hypothetical protein
MSIREPLEPVAERHVEMRACRFIIAAAAFTDPWGHHRARGPADGARHLGWDHAAQ